MGSRRQRFRRSEAVAIATGTIILGMIIFLVAVQGPWAGAAGNSGAGLCADRSPWGSPENSPYPGPPGVRTSRSWWPIGVTCTGPVPETGTITVEKPQGWGPSVVGYTSLIFVFLGATALTIQLRRPKVR